MENKIEILFELIKERIHKVCVYQEMFGDDDFLTTSALKSLVGLEEAFCIIAGHTYTEHLLKRLDEEFANIKAYA